MKLKLEPLVTNSKDSEMVSELLYEAFPEIERLPLELLIHNTKLDGVDFLTIYDEDTFVGFTYLITHKKLTYVQYLAIDGNSRSKGYGSLILSQIKEKYSENQIILNIEAVDEKAINYEQRLTRKKFYIRNGYESSGLLFKDRWGVYEVMVNGEKEVNQEEYTDLMRTFLGASLFLYLEIRINCC